VTAGAVFFAVVPLVNDTRGGKFCCQDFMALLFEMPPESIADAFFIIYDEDSEFHDPPDSGILIYVDRIMLSLPRALSKQRNG